MASVVVPPNQPAAAAHEGGVPPAVVQVDRAAVVASLKNGRLDNFLQVAGKGAAASEEFFHGLSGGASGHANLWQYALSRVHQMELEHPDNAVAVLQAIAYFVTGYMQAEPSGTSSEELLALVEKLSPYLMDSGMANLEDGRILQRALGTLGELYWHQARPHRERVAGPVLVHVLSEALSPGGRVGDVRRVFDLRAALDCLELADDEDGPNYLKCIVLHACVHPRFVRSTEGRRLIAHLFTMPVPFADEVHAAIKNQLPQARPSLLASYGDVYLRAWKASVGQARLLVESEILQDLMHGALMARQPKTAAAARAVLNVLHVEKQRISELDEAMYRLYKPVIWRARSDTNALVRRNHAALFFEAFPLQDPSAPRNELAAMLQQQFDCCVQMLEDDDAEVRALAVRGVCGVLRNFWILIPANVVRAIVSRLVNDLAFDARAKSVRAAVCDGLALLLEEHQSHPLLKLMLPVLKNHIDDKSEDVRRAFVGLLQYVKTLRGIRFWDIVPKQRLLLRLAAEPSPKIARAMVSLLLNSYLPHEKPPARQLHSLLSMLQEEPAAARRFFREVHQFVPVEAVCHLTATLYRALVRASGGEAAEPAPPAAGGGKGKKRGGAAIPNSVTQENAEAQGTVGQGSDGEHEGQPKRSRREEPGQINPEDGAQVEGVLELMVILWLSVEDQLRQKGAEAARAFLVGQLGDGGLQRMLVTFGDSERARLALLTLASRVPASTMPALRETFAPTLIDLPPTASFADYAPIVTCMVEWGLGGALLDLVEAGLSRLFGGSQAAGAAAAAAGPPAAKTKQRRGRKADAGPSADAIAAAALNPVVALNVARFLLGNPHLRDLLVRRPAAAGGAGAAEDLLGRLAACLRPPVEAVFGQLDRLEQLVEDGPEGELPVGVLEAYGKVLALTSFAEFEASASFASSSARPRLSSELLALLERVATSAAPALVRPSARPALGEGGNDQDDAQQSSKRKKGQPGASGVQYDCAHRVLLFGARLAADLAMAGFDFGASSFDACGEAGRWLRAAVAVDGAGSPFAQELCEPLLRLVCHLATQTCAFSGADAASASAELQPVQELWLSVASVADSSPLPAAFRAAAAELVRLASGSDPSCARPLLRLVCSPLLEADPAIDRLPLLVQASELPSSRAALLAAVARSRTAVLGLTELAGATASARGALARWSRVLHPLRLMAESVASAPARRAEYLSEVARCARVASSAGVTAPADEDVTEAMDSLDDVVKDSERQASLLMSA